MNDEKKELQNGGLVMPEDEKTNTTYGNSIITTYSDLNPAAKEYTPHVLQGTGIGLNIENKDEQLTPTTDVGELALQIVSLTEEVNRVTKLLQRSENEKGEMQNSILEHEGVVKNLSLMNQELQELKIHQAHNIAELKEEIEQFNVQLTELNRAKEVLALENQEKTNLVERLTSELQQKESDLNEKQTTILQLRTTIHELNSSLQEVQENHNKLNEDFNGALEEKTQYLTTTLDQVRSDHTRTAVDLTKALERITEQESKLKAAEENDRLSVSSGLNRPNSKQENPLSKSFFASAQAREKKATDAIARLKNKITIAETKNDKALKEIVACLEGGLTEVNQQAYFDAKKDLLRRNLMTLQRTSVYNTAINVILTVLAVCSVVGITALWLSGKLHSNLEKNGSMFAFSVTGDKQKAQQVIHEVTQAMGVRR